MGREKRSSAVARKAQSVPIRPLSYLFDHTERLERGMELLLGFEVALLSHRPDPYR